MIDKPPIPAQRSTTALGRSAWPGQRSVAKTLTDELAGRLTGVRRAEVRAQVVAALEDLRASVSPDSIAEMAVRLAEYRLSTAEGADRSGAWDGGIADHDTRP